MDREQALNKLEALRNQLLTVYTCSEKCEKEKQQLDALLEEQKSPAPVSFIPDAADKEETLRAEFDEKNSRKILKGWGVEALLLLVFLAILAGTVFLMHLDISAFRGFFLSPEVLESHAGEYTAIFSLQIIFSALIAIFAVIMLIVARKE
jgi:hypothetical protein